MPVARGLALALALWLGAQSAAAQEAPPAGEVLVTLDFQDADITEVISTIAKATGKNFLYDDRVRGRVTVISPEPVTADEAYRVFESILAGEGLHDRAVAGRDPEDPAAARREGEPDRDGSRQPGRREPRHLHHAADAAALREGRRDQRHDQAAGLERGHGDSVRADQHADHHRRGREHPAAHQHHRPDRRLDLPGDDQAGADPVRRREPARAAARPDLRRRDGRQRAGTAGHPPRPRRAAAAAGSARAFPAPTPAAARPRTRRASSPTSAPTRSS